MAHQVGLTTFSRLVAAVATLQLVPLAHQAVEAEIQPEGLELLALETMVVLGLEPVPTPLVAGVALVRSVLTGLERRVAQEALGPHQLSRAVALLALVVVVVALIREVPDLAEQAVVVQALLVLALLLLVPPTREVVVVALAAALTVLVVPASW
jgi:hypothetical protein